MSRIRKLYFFDKHKALEMISFLNDSANDAYINKIMFNPFIIFHHLLPLRFKYLPETFVLKDNHDIKGLITISALGKKQKKAEIKKLMFEEHSYDVAQELIQYAVSKYKALGASSVLVKADEQMPELLSLFVTKCGFTKLSYEKLWKVNKFSYTPYDKKQFRMFRNSDSQAIACIYNDSLLTNFRPFLSKTAADFKESMFMGLSYIEEYKYSIVDKKTKNVLGCISISTADNKNYFLDVIQSGWAETDFSEIISFAIDKIKKRRKQFALFVKTKRYTNTGEKQEKEFINLGYECVQNRAVLSNSSARILKSEEVSGKYTILNEFCPSSNIMPV